MKRVMPAATTAAAATATNNRKNGLSPRMGREAVLYCGLSGWMEIPLIIAAMLTG